MGKFVLILVIIVLAILAVSLIILRAGGGNIDTGDWNTYRNERYKFSIKYPEDWVVAEFSEYFVPVFNVYRKGENIQNLPFSHFSNEVHVSIFPQGNPTEGIVGEQKDSNVNFKESAKVRMSRDFTLENGEPWATMVVFQNPPEPWNSFGFIWARAPVSDYQIKCFRNGNQVSEAQCSTLMGDTIEREGDVDDKTRDLINEMLSTFEFI